MESLLANSLETLGTFMIAYAALRVHHRVLHEHRVDDTVFRAMKSEQRVGVLGVVLVLIGFLMEVVAFFV